MHYNHRNLLIFRSKDHMNDWRYNPYHGKKQRDFLVKLHIDFLGDMGGLTDAAAAAAGDEGDDSGNNNSHSNANSSNGKDVLGHRILPVKKKSYGRSEGEMYQFKLERWTNLGCSVLAAFASQEEDEVQILHDTISDILKSCPHNGLRNIDHMLK